MRSKKDLLKKGEYWLAQMRDKKFPVAEKIEFVVDNKQKTCFGTCQRFRKEGRFVVHLMPALRELDEAIVDNTIIHELIHTCPECWNHGAQFHHWGSIATWKFKLRYPIDTKGDRDQSSELAKTETYFKKAKLYAVDLVSGEVIRSFRTSGTRIHKAVSLIMDGKYKYGSGKWMVVKESGRTLSEPRFAPSVTEADKRNFNKKFASQGRSCYPVLMPTIELTVKTKTRPEIVATAVVPKSESVAAKKEKTIVIHTGTAQLSLF